ncbi:MAG: hypothetical protein DYH12_27580, partial [Sorangiineae bacterium PRO1]|nr:hypothetical protein [Sorangiineae bacterium PRO1]
MANRTTSLGLAAQLAALCFLATAACAAPTGIENESAESNGEPAAPAVGSGSGTDTVTGLAPSAGGATGSGGSAGA